MGLFRVFRIFLGVELISLLLILSKCEELNTIDVSLNCPTMEQEAVGRNDFPTEFVWGVGSSAGQVEGAALVEGRTASVWDIFSLLPGKILDGSNASIACDSYEKFQEDIHLAAAMGANAYRFSISWSRLLPNGGSKLNPKGVAYYSAVLEAIEKSGMKALVTLNHLDLPVEIDRAGGWLSPAIVNTYAAYAETCFKLFGAQVATWTTLNEPFHIATFEYSNGEWPPARCSNRSVCEEGDSDTEPYRAMHNMLLSHAAIVQLYRSKYQPKSGGQIGITLEGPFYYPYDDQNASTTAVKRAFAWRFGWAYDPIYYGDYPQVMKDLLGSRLPTFTDEEKKLLKGSSDYFGLNYYYAIYVKDKPDRTYTGLYEDQVQNDGHFSSTFFDSHGNVIGEPSAFFFRRQSPASLFDLLMWVKAKYPDVPIIIGENGLSSFYPTNSSSRAAALCDSNRVEFFSQHLRYTALAIKAGAHVTGFYSWSLLDSWEWAYGFTVVHGLVFVDFNSPARERIPKSSYFWWANFLSSKNSSFVTM